MACATDEPSDNRDGGERRTGSASCQPDLSAWDPECFATELSGHITGRGWNSIRSEFVPDIPDVDVVIAPDGTLESVAGLRCRFRCESGHFGESSLTGEFGQPGNILGVCETHYLCGGYPLELAIAGSDVSEEWEGALWRLDPHVGAAAYEGAPFEFSDEWNLGHADVDYEGCRPTCESPAEVGAPCGFDGCGDRCSCASEARCDPDSDVCVDTSDLCFNDSECAANRYCNTDTSTCERCKRSGACASTSECCHGSICVETGNTVECLEECTTSSQCTSGCCYPLQGEGSVCVAAELCSSCAQPGEACSPGECCPGAACIWVDYVGARCEAQSDTCPAGCENPYGSSCCRPPSCAGDCVGSPCCT